MEGLARPVAPSLRSPKSEAAPSLPRRVLRHLVVPHGLGLGARIIVGGDESERIAAFFTRLGIDAETADLAPLTPGRYDAAVWLDLEAAPSYDRSLLSRSALGRTARLLETVRPSGRFLLVAAIDGSDGHEPACLERHLATFTGTTTLAFFGSRTAGGLWGGSQSGHAVASWQAPAAPVEPALWRRRATAAVPAACCAWAATRQRQAA